MYSGDLCTHSLRSCVCPCVCSMVDWHDITQTGPLSSTAVCAAVSSVITKTLLYPIDTVKCRMQSGLVAGVVSKNGVFALNNMFNGLIPKVALYAPYQAVYMSTYTFVRSAVFQHVESPLLVYACSGVAAELGGSLIRVPMETIKQRMQSGKISSNTQLWNILRKDPFAFHRARNFLAQTCVHDIPCGAVHWMVYETLVRESDHIIFAGASAGAVAAVLTNPLDVVKTRMITRPIEHVTVAQTVRLLFREGGLQIFSRGIIPRVLHLAPNSALYMFVFNALYTKV